MRDELEKSPTMKFSKWILMKQAHHVDPVASNSLMDKLLSEVLSFQKDPESSALQGPRAIGESNCEQGLSVNKTRLSMKWAGNKAV